MSDARVVEPLELDDAEQVAFLEKSCGLSGVELRAHLEDIQRRLLSVRPYRCVAKWNFLDARTASLPAFSDALALRERTNTIWLDVGCCCGTDVRTVVVSGWPASRILGTDIEADFIRVGRELFREPADATTPAFIAGDLFDDNFLDVAAKPSTGSIPPLHELRSLEPLAGRVTVINAGSLFHLFDENTQKSLAHRLLSLLSNEKGSLMLGGQVGAAEGEDYHGPSPFRPDSHRRIYSPSKWIALWHSIDESLDCQAALQPWKGVGDRMRLVWSVKRR